MVKAKEVGGHKEGTVKFISKSSRNNSFNLEEDKNVWYILGDAHVENVLKNGDRIEFEYVLDGTNRIVNSQKISISERKKNNEDSKEEGWQDDVIPFEKLLEDAHKKFNTDGMRLRITTELLEKDMKEKWAIVQATVSVIRLEDDKTIHVFQAIGDATQENCQSSMIKPHFVRMAETRAIARALRWATNNAQVTDVETDKVSKVTEKDKEPEEKA
jgi:hypothetical protein